ncbi:antibiotic biosynthesis monooxygenase [Oceaniglobus trochenteri]|uniref:antibiotic biosynthesis monooxygenase n=1 Tax=Oceaniglobus trochenteri TaxID=2763260 RepID=UPI001CFFD102|nr:antibiotic biosynthesis monooxygenase [Oceaniglobus trochenteri]
MSKDAQPVLSVITRRFRPELAKDIRAALENLQKAAARQPGYLGEQNSLTQVDDGCELVTVFAFDSRANLLRWESSDVRKTFLAQLERHPQESVKHTTFDGLSFLLGPQASLRKIEIVAILIFWIFLSGMALGHLADLVLPTALPAPLRSLLLISVNVALISYVLLPWSSRVLTRVKARFSR